MITPKERSCIEKANEARLKSAEKALAELEERGMQFENPFSGMSLRIEWQKDKKELLKQIASLPVALVLLLLMAIPVPLYCALEAWDWHGKKAKKKKRIRQCKSGPSSYEAPEEKTLKALWNLRGSRC